MGLLLVACSAPKDEVDSANPSPEPGATAASMNTGPSDSAQTPNDDGVVRYFEAVCRSVIECPVPNDDTLFPRAYWFARGGDPLDNCLHFFYLDGPTEATRYLDPYLERALAGGLTVNIELLADVDCDRPLLNLSQVMVPNRRVGAQCQLHQECVDGYCDTGSACPGVCVSRRGLGEACNVGTQCLSEVCVEDACVPKPVAVTGLGEGEACSNLREEARYCARGLWCNEAGTCQPPLPAGSPCSNPDDLCVDGHVCYGPADAAKTCLRVVLLASGASCSAETAFVDGEFRVCDMTQLESCVEGACTRLPEGKAGAPCYDNDMSSTCAPGHYCEWESHTCIADTPVGQECNSSQECTCVNRVCSDIYCSGPLD